ncbi:5-carboxymethyl-2-hydroxymuconate Delta-isomerase [Streptomyces sp. NPDC020192]|uniref:5-carboxymethyl-2-hydroxymuconate Delta-isomerase n=1 Tax=Streptomyces sp. NPDC020192 TaxID=3365066 RepID=UPI0037B1BF51
MPQITVDCSDNVEEFSEGFDRRLHEVTVEIAAAKPESCKTLFRAAEASSFGYEDPERHAIVHVTIGLLAGRTEETKARLTEAVLELLREHLVVADGVTVHASAEVRDLDASYRKYEG